MPKQQIAIKWAQEMLKQLGHPIIPPEPVRDMPWSHVWRFSTQDGFIYLKQMAPEFSLEPKVVSFLFNKYALEVPQILAEDDALNCFLMFDAGSVMRDLLKVEYQMDLVCHALSICADIQMVAIEEVDHLLSLGVKDCRLANLPLLYQQFMTQETLLLADGLITSEINTLKRYHSRFSDLCSRLSEYPIPETLEHGDFQDNNILINGEKQITISDWGDAMITHPFFSLGSWLNSAMRHHDLQKSDPRYIVLVNTYLEMWKDYGTMDQLQEAFLLSEQLRPIIFTLNFSRVNTCPGMEDLKQFKGYMAEALREFINNH